MIDDTPDVRWSTAWWTKYSEGIALPIVCALLAIAGIAFKHTYAIAGDYFTIWFVPISGDQAAIMGIGYIGFGIAAFSHGYCRYDEKFYFLYWPLLAAGLVTAAVFTVWCATAFYTG